MSLIWTCLFFCGGALALNNSDDAPVDNSWFDGLIRESQVSAKSVKSVYFSPKINDADVFWDVQKVSYQVEYESGSIKNSSAVIFSVPESQYRRKLTLKAGLFKREISVYKNVLPLMGKLMSDFNDTDGCMLINPIGFGKNDEKYILPDLLSDGSFMRYNRTDVLDEATAKTFLSGLAKFHAMSAVLISTGQLKTPDLNNHVLQQEGFQLQSYYDRMVGNMVEALLRHREPDWNREPKKTPTDYLSPFKRNASAFNVINHGSLSLKYLYFKTGVDFNDTETDIPKVKFSGFHFAFINSPIFDVYAFITTSCGINNHTDIEALLKHYFYSLEDFLVKFNYTGVRYTAEGYFWDHKTKRAAAIFQAINQLVLEFREKISVEDLEQLAKHAFERGELPVDFSVNYSDVFIKKLKKLSMSDL